MTPRKPRQPPATPEERWAQATPLTELEGEDRDRAERIRSLLDHFNVGPTELEKKASAKGFVVQRTNVSTAASKGRAQFNSGPLLSGIAAALGLEEKYLALYLRERTIDLSTLISEGVRVDPFELQAIDFVRSVTGTPGLFSYLDADTGRDVKLGELASVVKAIQTGAARPYARPGGSHDYEQLFRDFRRGALAPVRRTLADGSEQARREQSAELGGEVPKKIRIPARVKPS